MNLHIIGGTYFEFCKDPYWFELYGSGLRAINALFGKELSITFHTNIGKEHYENLLYITNSLNVNLKATIIDYTGIFIYQHPLSKPQYSGIHSIINTEQIVIENSAIQFGAMEGNRSIKAKQVVYDPQSPNNPQSFWKNNAYADELIWVANQHEVETFTGCTDISDIKSYLFEKEKVKAAIIKRNTNGAILIEKDVEDFNIPVFKTTHVWPIGTGDIYTAIFGYNYLIKKKSLNEASIIASLATAYYTETTILPIPENIDANKFEEFYIKTTSEKKVYLAGPFFTMAQRWLIDQFRDALLEINLEVFSPYHNVGFGSPEEVAPLDINAIKNSDIVVAIADGLDAGTLFEIGYARSLNIPVIIFVQNEKDEALTMLRGTECIIESDFSTVIYKTIWEVNK